MPIPYSPTQSRPATQCDTSPLIGGGGSDNDSIQQMDTMDMSENIADSTNDEHLFKTKDDNQNFLNDSNNIEMYQTQQQQMQSYEIVQQQQMQQQIPIGAFSGHKVLLIDQI